MSGADPDKVASPLFRQPTSVFLAGASRPLLNWVAFALASGTSGGFLWTDVRLGGEVLDPLDPLARGLIPPDRFNSVDAEELKRDDFAGNLAVGGLVRSDEASDFARKFADFLRLPPHTRGLISKLPREGSPAVLVLSNAHRLVALYPTETVGPVIRSIVAAGASLLLTFADAPPDGRQAFDQVFHLEGNGPAMWRDAVLRIEKGSSSGPLRNGAVVPLKTLPEVASVLGRSLDRR